MPLPFLSDFYAASASGVMILLYYLILRWRSRRNPAFSVHRFNRALREAWVGMIAKSGKMDILAVQTLRNSVMAANFMASTSILLIIGVLNLSDKIEKWTAGGLDRELCAFKLGALLLDFSLAFYCFTMAIRFFNHVGYMINLLAGAPDAGVAAAQVCNYLHRAGRYYSLGTRGFFFSLPLILWFFGPYPLLFATALLLAALYALDRAP